MLMKWRRKDLLRKMYKIMLVEELTTRSKWLKRELDSLYEYCIQYLLNKYFHFKVTLYNTITCQSYCYMFSQYLRGSLKSFKIQLPKLKILARMQLQISFLQSIEKIRWYLLLCTNCKVHWRAPFYLSTLSIRKHPLQNNIKASYKWGFFIKVLPQTHLIGRKNIFPSTYFS